MSDKTHAPRARATRSLPPVTALVAKLVQTSEVRRPEPGTGNLYAMQKPTQPEKQKPLQPLPARWLGYSVESGGRLIAEHQGILLRR